MIPQEILNQTFLGNTVHSYLWFAGILLFGFIFRTIVSRLLSRLIYRLVKHVAEGVTEEDLKRLLIKPLELFIFLVFLYLAFDRLTFPAQMSRVHLGPLHLQFLLQRLYALFIICSVTWIVLRVVDFVGLIFTQRSAKTASKLDDQLVPFFKDFVKVLLVILAFFFVLANVFGRDITGLIAGLGIGGLALAFASKESLENLLASFTIFLDHPFTVGDLVQSGEIIGTVEKIGFRSTRIRTLEKSFVTVPNKSMIDKPLDNLTLRTFRRARFDVNLTYNTKSDQIRNIVADIKEFVRNHPRTNEDEQIKFLNLGPHSKDVMVQYFVDTMDWNEFINVKEEINYQIVEIVEKHGSAFAFPTTTVHLHKDA